MTKTVPINDSVHNLILKKQNEIKEKKGYMVQIKDITEKAIRAGIDLVE